jgi:hypothetical protein
VRIESYDVNLIITYILVSQHILTSIKLGMDCRTIFTRHGNIHSRAYPTFLAAISDVHNTKRVSDQVPKRI